MENDLSMGIYSYCCSPIPSLRQEERSLTRTDASISSVVEVVGSNLVLSFTLVSGGVRNPFI